MPTAAHQSPHPPRPLRTFGRNLLALACLAASLLAASVSAGPVPTALGGAGRPNFVVVMTDDQTVAELSVMRRTRALLAERGVSFTNFVASFPLCCPSRVSMLSGQYSHNHGVRGNGTPVGGYAAFDKDDTLASWLHAAGYHTTYIGKFLNGYPLDSRPAEVPPGWNEWHGLIHDPGRVYFNYALNHNGRRREYGRSPTAHSTLVYTRLALRAVAERAAGGGRPFFLMVGFSAPHLPAIPLARDRGELGWRPIPRPSSFNEANVGDKPRVIRALPRLSARKKRRIASWQRRRLETLLAVDRSVARIVSALQRAGLLRKTYVLFVSDNGFFFGEHRLPKGKFMAYEDSIRVPILLRGPGIPRGARSDALLANIDIAPTILELSGAAASVPQDGRSLLPFARNPRRQANRPILLEAITSDIPSIGTPYTGILTGRFKYIRYRSGEQELYDLARDPDELVSRHGDPDYAGTRRFLAARLRELESCRGAECRAPIGTVPGPR